MPRLILIILAMVTLVIAGVWYLAGKEALDHAAQYHDGL